ALWAEHAVIDRKLFPGFKTDGLVFFDVELDPALDATKATVRFDELVRRLTMPSTFRFIVQLRTKRFHELIFAECRYCDTIFQALGPESARATGAGIAGRSPDSAHPQSGS